MNDPATYRESPTPSVPRDVVISARGLGKAFPIYNRPSDMMLEALFNLKRSKPFWALKDINLDIRRGEVIGFLGPNGSGKSTLLRILADKLDLTSGSKRVNGHVTGLFELGTGFNMEMTGRENIRQVALYRGMDAEMIKEKFDFIVDFSELGRFIEQPLKTYSNGMKARLAFSTAICVNPEILMIDEVLGVGDESFSQKCSERMSAICASGATVLIVTHSTAYVSRLCNRAFYLENGKILEEGSASDVARVYERRMLSRTTQRLMRESAANDAATLPTATRADIRVHNFKISTNAPASDGVIPLGSDLDISFAVDSLINLQKAMVGLQIVRTLDNIVVACISNTAALEPGTYRLQEIASAIPEGRSMVNVSLPCINLGHGTYTVTLTIGVPDRSTWGAEHLLIAKDIGTFSIEKPGEPQFVAAELSSKWQIGSPLAAANVSEAG
jgi:ABC-type polysaccharide/polyol phosphate transport system ATPase subunit